MKKSTVLLVLSLMVPGFVNTTNAESNSRLLQKSIDVGKAKEIRTDISFFSGELFVNTETEDLAKCVYGYKDGFLRPEMTYREVGGTGYLTIESEEKDKRILNDNENRWNLSLNKRVKNNLSIQLRAGEANIDLEGSNLNSFDYKMTAGESTINLRNTSIPHLKFNMLAGEAHIDLSGDWENDGVADIKGGVGEITVKVPFDTGVIIYVTGVLGEVKIPFFNKEGSTYTNDSYKKSKNTLTLYINGAIGQINVEMVE